LLASSTFLAIGSFCLGLAPDINLAILGVVIMSMATAVIPLIRSLLSMSLASKQLNLVYSVMTMLTVTGSSLAGPIYAEAFGIGLRRGPAWYGLVYLTAGALAILLLGMIVFVNTNRSCTVEDEGS